jgi:UDP-3-O-[3-hydroxymyristoyl] glucosamine N-acyltransferase
MDPVRLHDLARQLDAELVGDGDVVVTGVAGLEHAGPGDITFLAARDRVEQLAACAATAVIIAPGLEADRPALRVADPYAAFARLLASLEMALDRVFPPGIHPTAVVDPTADVARAASIGPYCVIGAGASVGEGTRLGPLVVLGPEVQVGREGRLHAGVCVRERCRLGDRVILHTHCVVGSDGFGYRPGPQGLVKIPQVGIVVVEDDVELGAGTCVDRAMVGQTVVGRGSKLDNLVQVGHNVVIGAHCAISAQTGISGSCRVGDWVTMGGQVGLGDHLTIGDGVKIGAKSGLHRDTPAGSEVFGYPALEAREAFRVTSALRKLPDLLRTVARLERRLDLDDGARDDGAEGGTPE